MHGTVFDLSCLAVVVLERIFMVAGSVENGTVHHDVCFRCYDELLHEQTTVDWTVTTRHICSQAAVDLLARLSPLTRKPHRRVRQRVKCGS